MAALSIIGLKQNQGDFRLNVLADEEVDRETDAEIRTPRGSMRMEVGLIGRGNPEVISDKVGRMDRNDVILTDTLSAQSTAYQTAEHRGVRLIRMRDSHPVEEFREHLLGLQIENVRQNAIEIEEVEELILAMPLEMFEHRGEK